MSTPATRIPLLLLALCALSTQSGCETEAEPLDPRVERAIAEAGEAAKEASEAAKDARAAADDALESAELANMMTTALGRRAQEAGVAP